MWLAAKVIKKKKKKRRKEEQLTSGRMTKLEGEFVASVEEGNLFR